MAMFPPEEVEAEFQKYVKRGETGDWSAWADQFTEDALYVEHELGVFHGREEIRKWIVEVMAPVPEMDFPVEWHVIDGDRVIAYIWNRFKHPTDPSGEPFQFAVISVLKYAGNGQWSFEEDVYNAKEAEKVVLDYFTAKGDAAPFDLRPSTPA